MPSGFRNLRSRRIHCHRHCLSLVTGSGSHRAFIIHSGVLTTVHRFVITHNFVRMRAPVVRMVPNKTSTHPFVARRGTLSLSVCLHVTPRLCLGHLIMNNFRQMFRVGHGFHGRNVSIHRGPRFAVVRLCVTCTSCRSLVRLARSLFHALTRRILNAAGIACNRRIFSFNGPFRGLAVHRTVGGCHPRASVTSLSGFSTTGTLTRSVKVAMRGD